MAAIVKASSAIVKTSKLIPQKKGAVNKAKISSKSISLVPKPLQTKTNKQPPGALVKTDDAIKINPTPISSRNKRDNPILYLVKEIENKVIKIDKLLKTSFLSKKNQSQKERVIKEKKKFDKKEGEMEKKGNLPGMPKISGGIFGNFLDGLKRFFFFTLLGWLFFKLLPLIPKLYGIVNFIGKAMQFAFELFSGIVSGLTTFLAEGIKLTNTFTKGLGWLAGARTDKDFKKFEDTFNRVVDLTLLAAMLTADAGLDLFKRNKGGAPKGSAPRPGSGGRPRVTTSGGRSAGRFGRVREGIRNVNPLRKGPNVTTSGGRNIKPGSGIREGLRNANPLRRGPKITSSGGNALRGFRVPKINAKGAVSGLKTFGIGLLLDYGVQVAGEKIGENVLNKQTEEFKKKSPKEQSEIIKRIESRLKKEKEWQSGAGGFVDKIISLGGLMGPSSSENLSENLQKRLDVYKEVRGGSYYKGGVVGGYASGGFVKPTKNKPVNLELLTKKPDKIKSKKTIPGKDVGGEQQIKKIFLDTSPEEVSVVKTISSFFNPLASIFGFFGGGTGQATQTTQQVKTKNTTKNLPNPFQLLLKTSKIFKEDPTGQGSSLDFIGKIRASAIDTILGSKQDKGLYRSIASSILYLANSIANNRMYGIQSSISSIMGFQTGGNIPNQSLLSGNKIAADQENTLRSLTGSIEFEMEQSSNKVLDSVRGEIRKTAGTGKRGAGPRDRDPNARAGYDPRYDEPSSGGNRRGGGGSRDSGDVDYSDIEADTPEEKAFIATVRQLEGTSSKQGYNTFFGGSQYGGDLSKLTVNQVVDLQKKFLAEGRGDFSGGRSAAVGAGQFMYPEEIVRGMGLDPSKVKFTPELQNKMILHLAKKKRGIDVSKPLSEKDMEVLGKEWASFTPHYGQTSRTAGESLNVYNRLLQNARKNSNEFSRDKKSNKDLKVTGGSKPLDFTTSNYGMRIHPVTGQEKMHQGMDFAGGGFSENSPVSVIKPGKVIDINTDGQGGGYGNFVVVKHDDGTFSFYAHLNEVKVKKGDIIKSENGYAPIIGTVGNTGTGTAAHLHVEVGTGWNGGTLTGRKDPKDYVNEILRGGGKVKVEETQLATTDNKIDTEFQRLNNRSLKPGDKPIVVEGIGSIQMGKDFFGKPKKKYFNRDGVEISSDQFNQLMLKYRSKDNQPTSSPETPSTSGLSPKNKGSYDVIIPLDHVRPGNEKLVPDTRGGNTFNNASQTGAAGREREGQDKAAALMKSKLERMGYRVKIMTPEEFGSYEDYDKFIMKNAEKGTPIIPLHFDASRSGGGTGFLTRARSGDLDDLKLAESIQNALAIFQSKNKNLGNLGPTDTASNATINRASKSPAALVELGVMVDWERYYGKNFTSTSKFDELLNGIASAISKKLGRPKDLPVAKGLPSTRPSTRPSTKPSTKPSSSKPQRAWWDPRGWVGKEEGGSVIGKPQPNIPIPNKFASYETPGGKSYVAIQQIIVEKKGNPNKVDRATPSPSSSVLNSNRMDRMQSTSRK